MSNYLDYGYDYGSAVNEDYAVRIGDTIFVDFENHGDALIINCQSNASNILNYRAQAGSECIAHRKNLGSKYYNQDGTRMPYNIGTPYYVYYAAKVVHRGLFTASVYMEDAISINQDFAYNGINLFAFSAEDMLHMRKDQWHKVCYKIKHSSGTPFCDYKDYWVKLADGNKSSTLRFYFARRTGFLVTPYCVPSFERTHNWPIIYNEDIHLDWWY